MLTLWLGFFWGETLRFQTVHDPLQSSGWLGDLMRRRQSKAIKEFWLLLWLWGRTHLEAKANKSIYYTTAATCCETFNKKERKRNREKKQVTTCSSSLSSLFSRAAELLSSSLSSRSDMVVTLKNQPEPCESFDLYFLRKYFIILFYKLDATFKVFQL